MFKPIEMLESRVHLSGHWPSGVFVQNRVSDEVFVDPFGYAKLTDQTFSSRKDVQVYKVYADDPNHMTVRVSGSADTEFAIYAGPNSAKPAKVSGSSSTLKLGVSEKFPYFIAVRPRSTNSSGTFSLEVSGLVHAVIRHLEAEPGEDFARYITTISSTLDCDDYRFIAPVAGDWKISIEPTGPHKGLGSLDAGLIVYDKTGRLLGGSYTSPINERGPGGTESLFVHLNAGTRIYIRLDGIGTSTGWYHVRAELQH
jgi:hypothetical protein